MTNKDLIEIDYLILASLVNSDETEEDIICMVERFTNMRDYCNHCNSLNIHNPPSETK